MVSDRYAADDPQDALEAGWRVLWRESLRLALYVAVAAACIAALTWVAS
jgi:hypothetical protein